MGAVRSDYYGNNDGSHSDMDAKNVMKINPNRYITKKGTTLAAKRPAETPIIEHTTKRLSPNGGENIPIAILTVIMMPK